MTHQSLGNEVVQGGIVHRCSCGWVSRPCFSNMVASIQGEEHRENAAGNGGAPATGRPRWICLLCKSSQPGQHGTLDDKATPCPNGAGGTDAA